MRKLRLAGKSLWVCALVFVFGLCPADPTPAIPPAAAPALIAIRVGHLIDVVSGRILIRGSRNFTKAVRET